MMRYWPLSVIAQSPLVPPAYALEISMTATRVPSQGAYYAMVDIARQTAAVDAPNLVIIESTDAPGRRCFTGYPTEAEWLRLERTVFMENEAGFMFGMIDSLH